MREGTRTYLSLDLLQDLQQKSRLSCQLEFQVFAELTRRTLCSVSSERLAIFAVAFGVDSSEDDGKAAGQRGYGRIWKREGGPVSFAVTRAKSIGDDPRCCSHPLRGRWPEREGKGIAIASHPYRTSSLRNSNLDIRRVTQRFDQTTCSKDKGDNVIAQKRHQARWRRCSIMSVPPIPSLHLLFLYV